MKNRIVLTLSLLLSLTMAQASDTAGDIAGTIIVKRKLTKSKVTAPTGSYDQRGPAPALETDKEGDPLSYERSRVVVYIDSDRDGDKLLTQPITAKLEQKNRRFEPEVVVVPVGSVVSFPNLDEIFHNVFSLSKPKSFDLGNYPKGQTKTVKFEKPGVVFVNCHLHPNMAASIVVTPNRWSVRAEASGKFVLSNVPAGKYKLVAWHKAAGFFRQDIEVTAKGLSGVEFLIPLEER
jgi:plastocyanin